MSSDRNASAAEYENEDERRDQDASRAHQEGPPQDSSSSSYDEQDNNDGNNNVSRSRHASTSTECAVLNPPRSGSIGHATTHTTCPSHSSSSDLEACTGSESPDYGSPVASAGMEVAGVGVKPDRCSQPPVCPSGTMRGSTLRPRPRSRSLFPSGAPLTRGTDLSHHDTFAYRVEDDREIEREDEQEEIQEKRYRKRDQWRTISNFHFGWFGIAMSTGMAGQLLQNLPYQFRGLNILTIIVYILTLVQFVFFTFVSIVRYILWPRKFVETLQSPTQSLTLAMVPMALVTIINLTVYICAPAWGNWVLILAWVLWWIDTAMSLFVCFFVSFLLFTVHDFQLHTMTASWLLPAISAVVATSCGSIVANAMSNDNLKLITVIVCYIMWGVSVPFSVITLVVYYERLILHKLVPEVSVASSMSPVGPMGQGGFGIMQLGVIARTLFPDKNVLNPLGGEVFYVAGVFVALVMWGVGLLWMAFALASFICASSRIRFNLGWWAVIFPSGVFALSTVQLWRETQFLTFKVLAMIECVTVVLTWLWVSGLTLWKIWTGEIFKW